jgi:putative heme-binding domain-containing protein
LTASDVTDKVPDTLRNTRATFSIRIFILLIILLRFPVPSARGGIPQTKDSPSEAAVGAGKHLFERHCTVCHGVEGKGGRGPNLHRTQLEHAFDDAALKSVISDGIPPAMPANWFLTDDDLVNLVAYVRSIGKIASEPLVGDAGRGAQLFVKGGCANCHILAGTGLGFGPDLTKICVQRSPSHIKKSISRPSENLPEDFLLVEATTAAGKTIEGIRVNEDSFTIQIKDATGTFHSLGKRDLKDLKKLRGQTPMPPFEGVFTNSELDDLVAYLASRGKS